MRKKNDKPLEVKVEKIQEVIDLLQPYLTKQLLPFWLDN